MRHTPWTSSEEAVTLQPDARLLLVYGELRLCEESDRCEQKENKRPTRRASFFCCQNKVINA